MGWAGLSLPGGWALLGACLFLCRVVTAAAASSSCSSPTAAVVEGCQPLFALIALSIFAAFKLFSGLCAPSRRPRRRRHCCCFFFFSTRTWKKSEKQRHSDRKKTQSFCPSFVIVHEMWQEEKQQQHERKRSRSRSESRKCIPQMTFLKSNANAFCATCRLRCCCTLCERLTQKKKRRKTKQNKSRKCRTATAIQPPTLLNPLLLKPTQPYRLPFSS